MNAFLAHNHVFILTVTALNILLCLMPSSNQINQKQSHYIDDYDSIQESTTKLERQNHKLQTEEEKEEEEHLIDEHQSDQIKEQEEQDDLFFRIYDDLKK
ncbi:unnamed protein product [Paramecium sonneborni]|uniref:Transmembrane protein n=1 Tax=Paramecium sonneborni TaxID=65129 RepID=A0A8S1QXV3_9CILI|nr:unnamed protein product [Paramecium sonneborni]